jgi:hypothetical protein
LEYQPVVWIVLEINPSGWRCVGEAVMANTHKAQEGALGGFVVANTSGETSGVCCKIEEAIEMPCSDLLAIDHRKCIHGRMEIF